MIYSGAGFLAVVWFGRFPLPPSVSKLSLFLRLPVSRRSSLLTGDGRGGRGWGRSQILRRRESLVLYKPYNTLWHAGYSTCLYLNRCVTVAHLSLLSLCYILEKIPNGYPACLGNAWSHLHMCTVCTVLWELRLQYITYIKTVQTLMHLQTLAFNYSFLLLENYSTNLLKFSKPPEWKLLKGQQRAMIFTKLSRCKFFILQECLTHLAF